MDGPSYSSYNGGADVRPTGSHFLLFLIGSWSTAHSAPVDRADPRTGISPQQVVQQDRLADSAVQPRLDVRPAVYNPKIDPHKPFLPPEPVPRATIQLPRDALPLPEPDLLEQPDVLAMPGPADIEFAWPGTGPSIFVGARASYADNDFLTRWGGAVDGQVLVPLTGRLNFTAGGAYTGVSHGSCWTASAGLVVPGDPSVPGMLAATQFGVGFDVAGTAGLFPSAAGATSQVASQIRAEVDIPFEFVGGEWWFQVSGNWPTTSNAFLRVEEVLGETPDFLITLSSPAEFELSRGVRLGVRLPLTDRLFATPYWRHQADPDRSIVGVDLDWVRPNGLAVRAQLAGSGDRWFAGIGLEFVIGAGLPPTTAPRPLRPLDAARPLSFATHLRGPAGLVDIPK